MGEGDTAAESQGLKRKNLKDILGKFFRSKPEVVPLPEAELPSGRPSEKGAPPGFREIESLPLQVESIRKHLAEKITQAESGAVSDETDAAAAAREARIRKLQEIRTALHKEGKYAPESVASIELELHRLLDADVRARSGFGVLGGGEPGRRFSGDPQKSGVLYVSESAGLAALSVQVRGESGRESYCPLSIGIWTDPSGEKRAAVAVSQAQEWKTGSQIPSRIWYFYDRPHVDDDSQISPDLLRLHQMGSKDMGWFQEVRLAGASGTERPYQDRGLATDIPFSIDSHVLESRLRDSMRESAVTLSTSLLQETQDQ